MTDILPPLSLYIHIPWCVKKCPYCDFNSHDGTLITPDLEINYVSTVIEDLILALPLVWGRAINTIFIGGGTPSLFAAKSIARLLEECRSIIKISPFAEITLEANPNTADVNKFMEYKDAGINRLSIGIQSFNDHMLTALGRAHNRKDAIFAIKSALQYFDNINLDLMYALPKQNLLDLQADIKLALSFPVQHLSIYNLTIEPNTQFFNKTPQNLPDQDTTYQMQDFIIDSLQPQFKRYEISAFAQTGYQCLHNLNYWQFGDYLGIGAGAHSKLTINNKIIRQIKIKHPKTYMEQLYNSAKYVKMPDLPAEIFNSYDTKYILNQHKVVDKDISFEFMLNALRIINGVPINLFTNRTGLALNKILPQLNSAVNDGLLIMQDNQIRPTKLGSDFLNDLLIRFLER